MTSRIFKLASILLLSFASSGYAGGRWSRQLTAESLGDWVPLEPVSDLNKRQASARVLNQPTPFQSSFFPAESSPNDYIPQESPRQLYVQSIPTGQQAFLNPNPPIVQLTLADPQYNPLAQAFVSQPSSNGIQYNTNLQNMQFAHMQQHPLPSQIVQNPINLNNQFYNSIKSASNPASSQAQKLQKPDAPRFVDGYRLENSSADYFQSNNKKKPTSPTLKNKQEQIFKPQQRVTERSSTTNSVPTSPTVTNVEKEEVQLLYVPLETLQSEKFNANQYFKTSQQHEAIRDSVGSPGQINNQLYAPTTPNYSQRQQSQLQNIQQDLIQQAFNAQTLQGKFKQNQYDRQPKYQQQTLSTISFPFSQSVYPTPVITTPKSKKLKAHQPPLAIFMYQKPNDKAKLADVLSTLKGAKAISVLDNIGPNSPKVFIGPSTLKIPDYYTKFDLPYLSSVDGNRIQRKVDQLPFFVAPLSYKAPDGFAKIPFPAPHVGSVIINPYMSEFQSPRPTSDSFPSSYSFSTFQQNPSTESFRSTLNEQTTLKQNPFNYFPSATPNPVIAPQSTVSAFHSSFLPFEPQTFNSFRPIPQAKQPESNVVNSSRPPPLASYFSPTPSKPTVSYFSFASPEYTTSTTNKSPTTQNYQYRGHYITNSAVDNNNVKTKTSPKESNREIYRTTPLPSFAPTLVPQNPYSINNAFQPTGSQDAGEIKNLKVNEVREYNTEPPSVVQNSYSQYNNAQNSAVNENSQYSSFADYTPGAYYGQSDKPNEYESQTESSLPINSNDNRESYSPLQYQNPSANDEISNYQTEYQANNDITTPSTTTTTTTTTTVAPTTKATRRPIHLRGRPRYTTQKPDNAEHVTRTTTRRTPIRERKPNTYRSRQESSKAPAVDTTTETSNFESSKRGKVSETTESSKINRYSGYRNRPADDEVKTTTESALPKTSAANRNQRLRSRGKTHFRITDNYEGSDFSAKKAKKTGGDGESIAYQRDVLHQNYPVTLTERMSTIEIHTTPLPISQGIDLTNGKIKIYETTGSTQKSYIAQDGKSSESLLDYYDNQPVFQAESQKYLTQPESYVEVSSERSGNTGVPDIYITAKESSTERVEPSSSIKYEPEIQSNIEEQKNTEVYDIEKEKSLDNANQEIQNNEDVTEKNLDSVFETPIARFRSKLRSRPKALASTSVQKENIDNDYEVKNVNAVAINKKPVEDADNTFSITRRSSIQPVTYRPAFDKRRTTMRIEEIEAELKSSRRQQSRTNLHSSTLKYPVYIPESSSRNPNADVDYVEITTKRNHFVRRRPVKPTSSSVSSTSRPRVASEQSSNENQSNKRVRVRSRLRTRPPTTEKVEEAKQEESTESQITNDEKYSKSTERISSQKYTTRGRLATQKYLKKSSPATERNIQVSKEIEDQASYDSINRPEYIEYNPVKSEYNEYNPENGKAESHWSPKLSYNSFKPIFNPNFIADDIKPEGIEYGTKLPQTEFDDENSEIITARNPFEDMLISVTPASNNLNGETSNKNFGKSFYDSKNIEDVETVKKPASSLTFESVLEEVMKNLEEQDENEYDTNYNKSVMKQESGEIGEIPPESEIPLKHLNDFDIKKIEENQQSKSNAAVEDVLLENKITTTERQPRRRGVWRRIKVRPVNKDMLEGAESQFYTNSNNDLVKNQEKKDVVKSSFDKIQKNVEEIPKNHKPEEIPKNHKPEEIPKNHKPEVIPKNHKPEIIEETTTIVSDVDTDTEKITTSPGDMDLGIGSPEAAMVKMQDKITEEIKALEEIEHEVEEELVEKNAEEQTIVEANKNDNSNKTEINYTQRSVVTLISKEHSVPPTTTETPLALELESEPQTETTIAPIEENDDGFSSQNTEAPQETDENTTKSEEEITTKPETVSKVESVESTTSGNNYWDPKNVISTSMSTEISHETEICYRGRCIKTKKEDHKKVIT